MGRLHEALERAERDRQETSRDVIPLRGAAAKRAELPKRAATAPAGERYEALKANLLTRYPRGVLKTILFAGCSHGSGVSTTAVNFATALARDALNPVLLLEANLRTPSFQRVFKLERAHDISDLSAAHGELPPLSHSESTNVCVLPLGDQHCEPVTFLGSERFDQLLKTMRDRYDHVIIDAPPVHGCPECLSLAAKVDGVILVISSGETRRQVAISAKKKLEDAGCKLLGIVLNKRRYPIPGFIYRRL
jgi:capsular exopolysaccharide synthesis family protein